MTKVCITFCVLGTSGATLEGSAEGPPSLLNNQDNIVFPHILSVADAKAKHEGHTVISRRKRNILLPSGVKLCAQETEQQVIANHLSYFHLRGETKTESLNN